MNKAIFFVVTGFLLVGAYSLTRPSLEREAEHLNNSTVVNLAVPARQPVELGKVQWLRRMEAAVAKSEASGKPILILFQEVPGCMTCQRYGQLTLSHPLIVEAIESLFIPLAIFNNKKGKDAELLAYFGEPSWNNPVVRIVDADRKAMAPRLASDYSPVGLVANMIAALGQKGQSVPTYLQLLREELEADMAGTVEVTFSMYCFWTGEKELGQLDGVIATQPGFMEGREVVQVAYDPARLSFDQLLAQARQSNCASGVFTDDATQRQHAREQMEERQVAPPGHFRRDSEPKYYLSKTNYQYLPMTPLQATRANALIGSGDSPDAVFSPRQLQLLRSGSLGKQSLIGKDIGEVWRWGL